MSVAREIDPVTLVFADDGLIPNNALPLLIYSGAIDLHEGHPEKTIEGLFGANGWGRMWRNGVYDYLHFHDNVHEAMGVARGRAKVEFGGAAGHVIEIKAGDAAILPAGLGHRCVWASQDFLVIGAYPPDGEMKIIRPSKTAHHAALKSIAALPIPDTDPVYGETGGLVALWTRR